MKKHRNPLYITLYEEIRDNIISGEIPAESKLPSIRGFAEKKGVSTTTIENTYQQLLIEGYIESQPKKGYYTVDLQNLPKTQSSHYQSPQTKPRETINDRQSKDLFDIHTYRKIINTLFIEDDSLLTPCAPNGELELRKAIQKHLLTMRDVYSHPDSIVIASGIQQLIVQLTPVIHRKDVAYLTPGFKRARSMFELLNYNIHACKNIDDIIACAPSIIYLSPSNLYPSGEVIPINERLQLIEYARKHDALIIEDDYNHLFRYNAYQIPAIHSLAKGENVIYIGSFSRNTLVSNRMSYMVLPSPLINLYNAEMFPQTVSKIEQLAMARFISEGYYLKHLKKLAKHSKRKNEALKAALKPYMNGENHYIYGLQSNMHFVIRTISKNTFEQFIHRLTAMNFLYRTFDEQPHDILIPYSGIETDDMESTIKQLFS